MEKEVVSQKSGDRKQKTEVGNSSQTLQRLTHQHIVNYQ